MTVQTLVLAQQLQLRIALERGLHDRGAQHHPHPTIPTRMWDVPQNAGSVCGLHRHVVPCGTVQLDPGAVSRIEKPKRRFFAQYNQAHGGIKSGPLQAGTGPRHGCPTRPEDPS
jgi:hypothetical protein